MNKRQIEVEKAKLKEEAKKVKELKAIYQKAIKDIAEKIEISNGKIAVLLANWDDLSDDEKSIYQSQIYQKNFQNSLRTQLDSYMNALQAGQYESIDEYMRSCYEIGYAGAMYDLAGQGIPLIMPIDEKQVVTAMYVNSKISKRLYAKLGEDVEALKKKIASTLSRGIATADSYANIARNIASDSNVGFNRAMRITRTEGHRVQAQSAMDVCYKARDAGADIVKQWDATLDGRTRLSHRMVDGEIKELEEPFSNGLMYPGDPNGSAAEVINCRCALMQRGRHELDEDELEVLKERAAFFGLDKTENFNEYKRKYLKAVEKAPSVKNTVETAVKKVAPTKTVIKAKKIANVKGQVNGKAKFNQKHNDTASELFSGNTEVNTFCKTYGISSKERAAVYDYMSAKSYKINEKLRNKAKLTKEEEKFVETMNSALAKIPSYNGNLQRSLYFYNEKDVQNFLKDYTVGSTINYNQFISTSKGKTYNPDSQVQIYIQNSKKGKNLSVFNPEEDEILYGTGMEFKVLNIAEQDGKWYILLGEKQ